MNKYFWLAILVSGTLAFAGAAMFLHEYVIGQTSWLGAVLIAAAILIAFELGEMSGRNEY